MVDNTFVASAIYAEDQDDIDVLHQCRTRFIFPQHEGQDSIYLCGNSLGLQPKSMNYLIQQELKDWGKYGVEGHFEARNPWMHYHSLFTKGLSELVGAREDEVVAMNTLTVNLHLLMVSFYKPKGKRTKIIMEGGAFPSDQYAMATQVQMHGLNPDDEIVELQPRAGEHTLRTEDVLATIEDVGEELALVMMGGVNYYTGQFYDLEKITAAAHKVGALAGFDLAHAVGNVPLKLHEWNVDFACWCTYKYLNSGPGSVAGVFIHEKWGNDPNTFKLTGWWGNAASSRFLMKKEFEPAKGAAAWQMSNAPVFNMVGLSASLDIFASVDLNQLRDKSIRLTGYLEFLLLSLDNLDFKIITPSNPADRGCQLSLLFGKGGKSVFEHLTSNGVIADWREPNVIRIAPVPLYNSFKDVYRFYELLKGL